MKKIFVYFLIISQIMLFTPYSFADTKYKKIRGENLIISETNGKKGLIEKNGGIEILPEKYTTLKKIKYENKNVFVGEAQYYRVFYSPDGMYDNFIEEYIQSFSGIKFENYPTNGTIIYSKPSEENTKKLLYGIINVTDGILYVTEPVFSEVSYPDKNSIIARNINISFAPTAMILVSDKSSPFLSTTLKNYFDSGFSYNSHYGINLAQTAKISEHIYIKDNILHSFYENIIFPESNYYAVADKKSMLLAKNKPLVKIGGEFKQNYKRVGSVPELYDFIEQTYNIELKNYPYDLILFSEEEAEISENNNIYTLKYKTFRPENPDSLINAVTGLKISFQNPDNIIVKNAGYFGIVDKFGRIKVPFEYEKIQPLFANITEIAKINSDNGKLILEYKETSNDNNLYIAQKKKYNREKQKSEYDVFLINSNNEILTVFEHGSITPDGIIRPVMQKNQNLAVAKQNAENRKQFMHELPGNILSVVLYTIFLPFAILYPPLINVRADITYF